MSAPDPPRVGASEEVIREHADRHPCGDADAYEVVCPCGSSLAIVCDGCGEPVFVVVQPGTWCVHAHELVP